MMYKLVTFFVVGAATLFGQYTAAPAGAPPSELSPGVVALLETAGHKIVGSDGKVWAELWFRTSSVDGPENGEINVSWTTAPVGVLIGAIRFPEKREDRRGQVIPPGVYTLRVAFYPVDGAHQGLEPTRDFVILSPAATDTDPNTNPTFKELMEMSRKASGTGHPAVMAIWKATDDWKEGLSQLEQDWVFGVKIGETPIMMIVKGVNPGA